MPRNTLLAALNGTDLERLAPHLESVRLERGTVIAEVGDELSHVFFPDDCVISLIFGMADGRTAEAGSIGREGMVGFVTAMGDRTAIARNLVQLAGRARRLELAHLETAFTASPAIRQTFLRYAHVFLGQVMQSVACNALHPVTARLCRWLLTFHDRADGPLLRLTQEFLAEMLGVQRTTVTLVAGELQRAGLIRYRRGVVEILDRPGLERASCECYRANRRNYERLLPHTYDEPMN
jgi:CRP-like cAMP-binding protein